MRSKTVLDSWFEEDHPDVESAKEMIAERGWAADILAQQDRGGWSRASPGPREDSRQSKHAPPRNRPIHASLEYVSNEDKIDTRSPASAGQWSIRGNRW